MKAAAKTLRRFLVFGVLFLMASTSWAQAPPVRMQIEPLAIRSRSGGPVPVRIKLEYNSQQIMEGQLRLQVFDYAPGPDVLATIERDVVLQGSDYIFDTVLPPLEHPFQQSYAILAWFKTESGTIPLSSDLRQLDPPEHFDLLTIGPFERQQVLCSVSGERDYQKPGDGRKLISNIIDLADFNPPTAPNTKQTARARRKSQAGRIQTFVTNWNALDLPEAALSYCAFDQVLLADQATCGLNQLQMSALLQWVKAGGSLCVLADDTRLRPQHLEFLRKLFERTDQDAVSLELNEDGSLLVIGTEDNFILRHLELGRVALVRNAPESWAAAEQGQLAGHLHSVRANSPVLKGKTWGKSPLELLEAAGLNVQVEGNQIQINGSMTRNDRGYSYEDYVNESYDSLGQAVDSLGVGHDIIPRNNPLAAFCEVGLMPEGISIVPAWFIGFLLLGYVIAIGPADYLLLGKLRLRKLTWILFPVLTAGFTIFTLAIADAYMSTTEEGGSVTITDIGGDGLAIRSSTVDLQFCSSQRSLKEEFASSFVVPTHTNNAAQTSGASPGSSAMITYQGSFPSGFKTERMIRKWEPQMTRSLTFAPADNDIPGIDWADIELLRTPEGRRRLASLLKKHYRGEDEPDVLEAVVLHRGSSTSVLDTNRILGGATQSAERLFEQMRYRYYQQDVPDHARIVGSGIMAATQTNTDGIFQVVSKVAPGGAATMEDLPILDKSDPKQWALVIVVKRGEDFTVYRRLYVKEASNE